MKTIIAGSRDITSLATVGAAILRSGFPITEVVSGTARGVDQVGEEWARMHLIPIKRFPAQWRDAGGYNPAAGHIRNRQMADYADALVAVWDGRSSGTRGMIEEAGKRGLRVFVYTPGATG